MEYRKKAIKLYQREIKGFETVQTLRMAYGSLEKNHKTLQKATKHYKRLQKGQEALQKSNKTL